VVDLEIGATTQGFSTTCGLLALSPGGNICCNVSSQG
jgi:hypothetical protein